TRKPDWLTASRDHVPHRLWIDQDCCRARQDLQSASCFGGPSYNYGSLRIVRIHPADRRKEYWRIPVDAEEPNGLVNLGDAGEAAHAKFVFVKTFAIGAERFFFKKTA